MTRKLLWGLFTSSMLLAAASPAADLQLTVTFPARVTDGDPLIATASLFNISSSPQRVMSLQPLRTLQSGIQLVERFESDKCTATEHYTPAHADLKTIVIAPGNSETAQVDIGAGYPLGLLPGQYKLWLSYVPSASEKIISAPVTFEVVPPVLGSDAIVYRKFLNVCRAVSGRNRNATDLALDFAKAHSSFPYTRALLQLSRQQSAGESRIALIDFLMQRFPGSREAEAAASDRERLMARSEDLRQYGAYLIALERELAQPENAAAARDFRKLVTITTPDDFATYEMFLARYPRSFFRNEIIHRMIVAIDQGVSPAGRTSSEMRRSLYTNLLSGNGYWATRARREASRGNLQP